MILRQHPILQNDDRMFTPSVIDIVKHFLKQDAISYGKGGKV